MADLCCELRVPTLGDELAGVDTVAYLLAGRGDVPLAICDYDVTGLADRIVAFGA